MAVNEQLSLNHVPYFDAESLSHDIMNMHVQFKYQIDKHDEPIQFRSNRSDARISGSKDFA